MTTTIALETSKGNLELALALGIILVMLAIGVNSVMHVLKSLGQKYHKELR
jgi:tungstate transport system permease protein